MTNAQKTVRKKHMTMGRRDAVAMYLFLAPTTIGYLLFVLYPTVKTIVMSFFKWDISGAQTFIGLSNYIRMFTQDRVFFTSVRVTLTFTLWSVALNLLAGFILACLLNRERKSVGVYRTLYYIPCMIAAGAPSMVMWRYIFADKGLLNATLAQIGIEGPRWLASKDYALTSLIIMSLWGVGSVMIIFISGLKAVPDEYYESAEIDGAGYFRKLFSITLPVLSPVILYNLIMGIIGSLQAFSSAYVMTQGGPRDTTMFYALNIYNQAFSNSVLGYASALAMVLFAAIMLLTLIIFRTSARWVFYGDGM